MADERFRRAPWNRPPRRLAPGPDAVRATGIAEIYPVNELAARLSELLGSARRIYVPLAAPDLYAPAGFRAPVSVARQMVDAIVARLPPGREVQDVGPHLARLRLVKDEHEVAALRRAAEISASGMLAAMRAVRPGMNDLQVAGIMEAEWKRLGSPRASFAPIVASGSDALVLFTLSGESYHAVDRVMREGELLFVDYGAAEYAHYASDLCRTLPVSGRFSENQRRYYDIVLEAQNAAISAIKPGVMMLDVVKAAAGVFRKHGLERFEDVAAMGEDHVWGVMPSPTHFLARHGALAGYSAQGLGVRDLGHHIGLEAVERRDYTTPLEPGWVFMVEPKLYIPDEQIAIMIEDMVLVTQDGCEVLSAGLPREAEAIERIMTGAR